MEAAVKEVAKGAPAQAGIGVEILCRIVRVVLGGLTVISWLLFAIGAFSVYWLWSAKASEYSSVQSVAGERLLFCLGILAAMVVESVLSGVIRFVFLVPLGAKIERVDLRDPDVSSALRTQAIGSLVGQVITFSCYVAVPVAIAHFRFHVFS
jgi:hypothetical protein